LRGKGLLHDGDEERWTQELEEEIAVAVREAEALPPPALETLFTDVYEHMPRHIEEQMKVAVAMGAGTKFEGAFPL
jgi:TPP-dependent pyruvate/acetoin dehydrogenase alpha subunit